ncbi:MAG: ATP-binding protein [Microcella pacifica]
MDAPELQESVDQMRRLGRDTSEVEVKASVGGLPTSLGTTVSAFSNTHGGTIILGLDEKQGFAPADGFQALPIADAFKKLVRPRQSGESQPNLQPDPIVEIRIMEFEGAEIVVGTVEELPPEKKPCFVTTKGKEQGSYERLLDGDHRMSTHAIFLLSSNHQQPVRDIDVVPGTSLADLDEELVAGLLSRVRRTRPRLAKVARTDEEVLAHLRVLDPDLRSVTLAGYLALGSYPQERLPQLMISYAHFPAASPDGAMGEVRMLDRANFEGPIPWMISDAVAKLEGTLPRRRVSLGSSSRDVGEIPTDVIREALVNAVAHRDYSAFSEAEQVRVELYPDRLDITNPGGIWGGRREVDLLDGISRSRNSYLTRLLPDVPLPDSSTVSENQGTGIRFMVGSMKSQGLPLPTFRANNLRFTTSLARHGLMDPAIVEHLRLVGAGDLDERSLGALALAIQKNEIDDQVVRYQLDMDSLDAWRLLVELESEGWLERGRRGGHFYATTQLVQAPLFDSRTREKDLHPEPILAMLLNRQPLTVHEISTSLEIGLDQTRRELRRLVSEGKVVPTAPATSRRRAYRLPS